MSIGITIQVLLHLNEESNALIRAETDLAIGSYLSGHAVILRSKAVVQLGFSMSSSSQNNSWKIAPNSKVNVKTCLSYTSEKLGIGKLGTVQLRNALLLAYYS